MLEQSCRLVSSSTMRTPAITLLTRHAQACVKRGDCRVAAAACQCQRHWQSLPAADAVAKACQQGLLQTFIHAGCAGTSVSAGRNRPSRPRRRTQWRARRKAGRACGRAASVFTRHGGAQGTPGGHASNAPGWLTIIALSLDCSLSAG